MAAKVRLEGAVKVEFEVKFGLSQDLTLTVHAIDIESDGKVYRVLVGEGDISNISEKTLSFIGDRIESLLKKDKALLGVDGFGGLFKYGYLGNLKDDKLTRALFKTELGKLMLKAYERRDVASVQEVLKRNLWFVSRTGMTEFASLKKVMEKAKDQDMPFESALNVQEVLV